MNRELAQLLDKINLLQTEVSALKRIEFASITNPFMAVPLSISIAQTFPALRGLWVSHIGRDTSSPIFMNMAASFAQYEVHMYRNGTPVISLENGYRPVVTFSGSSEWWVAAHAYQFNILGTENEVLAADRGLTIWAWVRFDNTASAEEGVFGKRDISTDLGYWLNRDSSGYGAFGISNDGTTPVTVNSNPDTIGADKWVFMAGRFDPSTEIKLWLNGETYINTTSIPASLHSSAEALWAGTTRATTGLLTGSMSIWGVCAAKLPDETISNYYNLTKNIYDNLWTP